MTSFDEINTESNMGENVVMQNREIESQHGKPQRRPPSNIWARNAVINEITFDGRTTFVTINYREMNGSRKGAPQTVRLVVTQNTSIWDEWGRAVSVRSLSVGMIIDAQFSTAMTMSIPPQAQAFQIRIVRREPTRIITKGRIAQIDTRNQFILVFRDNSPSSLIRFNITPQTIIFDLFGRQIRLNDLLPGLRVQVEHADFMTASIPPQTTAFVVRVIR